MKIVQKMAAQGDVMFVRALELPAGVKAAPSGEGRVVVAHSETGHDHFIVGGGVELFTVPEDPLVCYLRVSAEYADVVHGRAFDTHETVRLPRGDWQIRRQREYVPGGYRRVED